MNKNWDKWGEKLKCIMEKKIFQFLLDGSGVVGRADVDRKTDTLNARSPNFSFVRGMNSCLLLADRRTVWQEQVHRLAAVNSIFSLELCE